LQAVVRTMKALAAASIGQYEHSVRALADYDRTVRLGLGECLRQAREAPAPPAAAPPGDARYLGATVFGSDQGLVGQFNEQLVEHVVQTLDALPGTPHVWAVGERIQARLVDAGLHVVGSYSVPNSVDAIAPLVGRIVVDAEAHRAQLGYTRHFVFHNRPVSGSLYDTVGQRMLPLDETWRRKMADVAWPRRALPEVLGGGASALRGLVREYLFISLFRACAESLASENASRLAAMERADRNIRYLLEALRGDFHRERQGAIDEELFDVTAGYEALAKA
jgi:F-type H+-transporting ATPase subunit gamma